MTPANKIDTIPTTPKMPAAPNSLTFFADQLVIPSTAGLFVSAGYGIHTRRKLNTCELIHIRSGALHMREDGRPLSVSAGQTLILHPNRQHEGARPYDADLSFYWMHFKVRPVRQKIKRNAIRLSQISKPRRPEQLIALMHHLIDDRLAGMSDNAQDALLMNLILCEAARTMAPAALAPDGAALALASRAESFIQEHSTEPISTIDVAEHLQCNPDYLGRIFRHVFDCTLTKALHRHRVREAGRLLQQTPLTVEQVAERSGFGNATYLRRIFRRHTGVSPRQYAQLHRRMKVNRS